LSDRVDYVIGKHTLQFGFDMSRAWDSDNNDGGADPNEAVEFGSFLGSYEFSNLEDFALGEYNVFSQTAGNPTFSLFACRTTVSTCRTLPRFAEVDARNGLARGLPGLPAARRESRLPAHRTVSQSVSPPGAAPRICLAAWNRRPWSAEDSASSTPT
jgi:hypothetical protein